MGYIEQSLTQGEQIRYYTKLHWIIFIFPILLIVISFCLALVFSLHSAALIVATLFFLVGILLGVPRFITYKTSEFAVTNKRVLIKVGFIKRHSLELLLQKVEGIGVDQDFFGRIFGYGTIMVTGTGGTKEDFKTIGNPLEFRKQVQQSISQ